MSGDPAKTCSADVNALGTRVEVGANYADYYAANDPCGGWTQSSTSNANHGTAVASILGGTYSGVAKGVTFVPVKVGSCNGNISDLGIAWGLDWIIGDRAGRATNAAPAPPALVNMSLWVSTGLCNGVPCMGAVENNIQNVIGAGIPVIVSANNRLKDACGSGAATSPARLGYGNYSTGYLSGQVAVTYDSKTVVGNGTMFVTELSVGDLFTVNGTEFTIESISSNTSLTVVEWPSASISWASPTLTSPWRRAPHRTITVGGSMYDSARGDIAWNCQAEQCDINGEDVGSNFGRCVDIYAPAWQVQVASGTGVCGYRTGTLRNGTSYASPVVAGVVARLLGTYPSWTPTTIWYHLLDSATYVTEDLDGGPHTNHKLVYASPYQ